MVHFLHEDGFFRMEKEHNRPIIAHAELAVVLPGKPLEEMLWVGERVLKLVGDALRLLQVQLAHEECRVRGPGKFPGHHFSPSLRLRSSCEMTLPCFRSSLAFNSPILNSSLYSPSSSPFGTSWRSLLRSW